jgi:hypothetical protein
MPGVTEIMRGLATNAVAEKLETVKENKSEIIEVLSTTAFRSVVPSVVPPAIYYTSKSVTKPAGQQ